VRALRLGLFPLVLLGACRPPAGDRAQPSAIDGASYEEGGQRLAPAARPAGDVAAMTRPRIARADDPCVPSRDRSVCTEDGTAWLTCRSARYTVDSRCRGPRRCVFMGAFGGAEVCDTSVGEPGDPCLAGSTCNADNSAALVCEGGHLVVRACAAGLSCTWSSDPQVFTGRAACVRGDR
jgi:hypothetical protein